MDTYLTLQRRFDRAVLPLALACIPLTILEEIYSRDESWQSALLLINALIWLAFVLEYVTLLRVAPERGKFVRERWLDAVIILASTPMILPTSFASVRALRLARMLRLVRSSVFIARAMRSAHALWGRQSLQFVALLTVVVVFFGAILFAYVEHKSVKEIGEGLWWAAATVTTVGYGDISPKTALGRIVAVCLMLVGISLVAVLTGTIASLFVASDTRAEEKLDEVLGRLKRLEEMMETR